jgi:hypothetical protein
MKRNLSYLTTGAAALLFALMIMPAPDTRAQAAPAEPSAKPDEAPAPLPAETLLAEIKATRYADRTALRTRLQNAERHFADKLNAWEAKKNALPEKERADADEVFKRLAAQREVLRQKIDGVEDAREETWKSATSELYVVLQNAISTYRQLQALFDA